nr:hypothetical protein [Tanacetum cinerariifolium]
MDESQSYLTSAEHKECYDGLIKSYELDKSLFSTYDKVYSLKRSQKDKDKYEDPSGGSDRGLKKGRSARMLNKQKSEEPEFKVADFDILQDQEVNLGKDDEEPRGTVASKCDWFTKPKRPQEPIDPDWNEGNTPQQGPTQSWLMCSDELYKFSDGTLTRLQTSLDDITKNIQMEYLPQRRWSSLEKKRANIMIEAIDKKLKDDEEPRKVCW